MHKQAANDTKRDNKTTRPTRVVMVGHVDHGKSTLVGRLLHDTNSLPEGKEQAIADSCRARGVPFEWAFLMDALSSERDQNITIDTAQIWLRHNGREIVIIDAPGHREFIKNMVTGASQADAAIILVAADEGVQEQSRRHGYLLSLLGIKQIAVAVNKMDLVDYQEETFSAIKEQYTVFLAGLDIEVSHFIPVSAREGDNVTAVSVDMPWYRGPSVAETLIDFDGSVDTSQQATRFPLQDVYRFDERRILAGRLETGTLSVGDELTFWPSGEQSTVATIETWAASPKHNAYAGESIGITLTNQVFAERGTVATRTSAQGPQISDSLQARVFWLGKKHLRVGDDVKIKLVSQQAHATIDSISRVIDGSTLHPKTVDVIERHDVAELTLRLSAPLVHDVAEQLPELARFVLVDNYDVAGGGLILQGELINGLGSTASKIGPRNWYQINGHFGGVLRIPRTLSPQLLARHLLGRGIRAAFSADDALLEHYAVVGIVAIGFHEQQGALLRVTEDTVREHAIVLPAADGLPEVVAATSQLIRGRKIWYPNI